MKFFKELQDELSSYLDDEKISEIEKAYLFAKQAHQGQIRRTGESYIVHPVAAALILAKLRLDYQSIIATLLHDVLEDTNVNKDILRDKFDDDIANLVDGVSKLKQIQFSSQAEAQAENFRKMLLAMVKDIRVILVKLGDRLHNMRTLDALPLEKQKRIALETLEIYAPIANRLGIHKIYTELEDLCFKALYPMRYRILKDASEELSVSHTEMLNLIKEAIKAALGKNNLNDFEIYGRKKHIYSLYRKMLDKHTDFQEIMDKYGIRIVVNSQDECYRALGLIHSLYKPVIKKFKDYIAIPKSNSYQSLHTVLIGPFGIPIEVQIRTKEMHQVANMGIAAHWLYKSASRHEKQVGDELVKQLSDIQESVQNSLDFIESVKVELFPDEVYVFTPKGDIVKLPKNSTPVDFAYQVHSEVGNTTVGARINRKFAPLNSKLSNGQTVDIVISKDARPNESWLNFVCTSKARNSIKHYLRDLQKDESTNLGKRLLEQELSTSSISIDKLDKKQLNKILEELNLQDINELYFEIGLGNQYPIVIAKKILSNNISKKVKNASNLQIKGTEGMVVHFSKCCYPIPGDLIVGKLHPGQGLDVHRENCKEIGNYTVHPELYIRLSWGEGVQGDYRVNVATEVINKKGVLAELATAISNANSNIENITVDPRSGSFTQVYLTITAKDRTHLAQIMKNIKKLKFVMSQSRIQNIPVYE